MKLLNGKLGSDELKEYIFIKEYLDSKKSCIDKACDYVKKILKNILNK